MIILGKDALIQFVKLIKRISWLELLVNRDAIDDVEVMKQVKRCVSDISLGYTEIFKELFLDQTSARELEDFYQTLRLKEIEINDLEEEYKE